MLVGGSGAALPRIWAGAALEHPNKADGFIPSLPLLRTGSTRPRLKMGAEAELLGVGGPLRLAPTRRMLGVSVS